MNLIRMIVSIFLCIVMPMTAYAENQNDNAGKHLVLNLVGSGDMYESVVV